MSLQLFTGRDIEPSQAQQTTVEEPELPEAVGWNQVQVCTWIGNQIMTQPSMFERGEVTKFVRSLGRNAKLRAMFPGPYTAAQMHDHYQAGVRAGMGQSQDAKRYRWLREQQWQDNKLGVVLRPKDNTVLGCFIPSKELLDGAIDRYMSGKNDAMQGGQQP